MTLIEELEKWKKGFDEVAYYHNGDYGQGMKQVLDGLDSKIHSLKRKEISNNTKTDEKNYYAEISIKYKDYTIDEDEPSIEPYEGNEILSLTCNGTNEINAIENITKKALNEFNQNFSENIVIEVFSIDLFYETSDDARSS